MEEGLNMPCDSYRVFDTLSAIDKLVLFSQCLLHMPHHDLSLALDNPFQLHILLLFAHSLERSMAHECIGSEVA